MGNEMTRSIIVATPAKIRLVTNSWWYWLTWLGNSPQLQVIVHAPVTGLHDSRDWIISVANGTIKSSTNHTLAGRLSK